MQVHEQIEVTAQMVRQWQTVLEDGQHTPTLKKVVAAFRCAAHFGDEGNDHAV